MSDNTNRIFILRAIDYSDSSIIYDAIVEKKEERPLCKEFQKVNIKTCPCNSLISIQLHTLVRMI